MSKRIRKLPEEQREQFQAYGEYTYAALLQSGNREEVIALSNLTSFLVSIGASIVGYYICKWLDRHSKGK